MDVPFPRAASRRLISFLTFQISMFFSASLGCSFLFPDDMVAEVLVCEGEVVVGSREFLVNEAGGASDKRRTTSDERRSSADWRRVFGGNVLSYHDCARLLCEDVRETDEQLAYMILFVSI